MEGGGKTTGVTADLPTESTRAAKAKGARETPRYIRTWEHQNWPKPWADWVEIKTGSGEPHLCPSLPEAFHKSSRNKITHLKGRRSGPSSTERTLDSSPGERHLLLGMPSRRCSFLKPLKVAFKA